MNTAEPGWGRPRGRARGFTLMEVMVALGVLALGIGGVLAMFTGAAAIHRRALDETAAAIIAESAAAEFRAEFNADAVRAEASADVSRRKYQDPVAVEREPVPGFPLYSCSLRPTVLERERQTGRAVQVYLEVAVVWQRRGAPHEEVYRTILFRE